MTKINARSIDMSNFRVENKSNINLHGHPATSYSIYEFSPSQNAFVHARNGYAPGYNASNRMCAKDFLAKRCR